MCKRISATGGGNAHASCKGAALLTGSIPPHRPAALHLAGQQHHPSPAGSIILPRQLAASHLAGQQHPTLPAGSIPPRQPAASHLAVRQHPTLLAGSIPPHQPAASHHGNKDGGNSCTEHPASHPPAA